MSHFEYVMRIALPLRSLTPFAQIVFLFILCIAWFVWPAAPAGADTNVGGTIGTDTTWTPAGSPYIVSSSITVKGTDGADGVTTLTIEPGVTVRFNRYQMMTIGASSGDPGALAAQGTAAGPIVFTSNEASPAAGDWYYIYFPTPPMMLLRSWSIAWWSTPAAARALSS